MRKFLIPLLAATALAVPSAAQAGGGHDWGNDDNDTPPAVVTLPTSVTNETEANNYAKAYVILNAGAISGVNLGNGRDWGSRDRWSRPRRVTISDVAAACLQHPVIAARFGCITRFNITIRDNDRRGHGDHRFARASGGGGDDDWGRRDHRRDRVRSIGCLAALRIVAGPGVTPTTTVAFADCVLRPTPVRGA